MLPIRILFKYWWIGFVEKIRAWYHWFTYKPGDKTVVVIGGSWGGYTLAKKLANGIPSGYRVLMIEQSKFHAHTFAYPRYSVVGGYEEKIYIPISNQKPGLWPKGSLEIITGKCVGVNNKEASIQLDDGSVIPYEYLAVATGAKLSEPAPQQQEISNKEDSIKELRQNQKIIEASNKIGVIGAGAVGVELAADIKCVYPEKHVVLFCSRDRLLIRFDKSVHEEASKELEKLGVETRYQVRPIKRDDKTVLLNNEQEDFDMVFKCTGERPNSQGFEQFTDPCGYIKVNDRLQVVDHNEDGRIFSIGDVNDIDAPKMARSAISQASVVCENIKKMAYRDGPADLELSSYTPAEVEGALLLTLGTEKSILYLNGKTADYPVGNEDLDPHYIWDYFNVARFFGPGTETCEKS